MKNKTNAFTLIETLLVVVIIWILIIAMTIYLWWTGERSKIIEAESCANTMWNILNNYAYQTLTSKNLKIWDEIVAPKYYFIQLSGSNSCYNNPNADFCDEFILWYSTWNAESPKVYEKYTSLNTCNQNKSNLKFYRSGSSNIDYLKMNKWFLPTSIHENNTFYMQKNDNTKLLIWDIIIVMCTDNTCSWRKEIWKFRIDARSQTITLNKCKFYDEDNLKKCKERTD